MPWKECNVMDERVKFIARFLEGEKVASLAEEFGISRKTAYKIIDRYEETGLQGLTDRSRRPYRHANQLPFQIETLIVRLKQEKPTWGAPKIAELLARRDQSALRPNFLYIINKSVLFSSTKSQTWVYNSSRE